MLRAVVVMRCCIVFCCVFVVLCDDLDYVMLCGADGVVLCGLGCIDDVRCCNVLCDVVFCCVPCCVA